MDPGSKNGQTNRSFALAVRAPIQGAITSGAFVRVRADLSATGNPFDPAKPGGHRLPPAAHEHSGNITIVMAAISRSTRGGPASESTGYTSDASGLFTLPTGRMAVGICFKRVKGLRNPVDDAQASAAYASPCAGLVTDLEAEVMPAGRPVSAGCNLRKAISGNPDAYPALAQGTGSHPRDTLGSISNPGTSSVGATNLLSRACTGPRPTGRIVPNEVAAQPN